MPRKSEHVQWPGIQIILATLGTHLSIRVCSFPVSARHTAPSMARASSTSTSRFTSGLASQGAALVGKLKQTDGLTWAVLAAIVIYVAVASPANTPTIFRNTLFRFCVFAFVVVVFLVEGPVIGTMFALAMLLPIVYSSIGAAQEGFEDHSNDMVDEEMDENVQTIETDEKEMDVYAEDAMDGNAVQASVPEMFSFTA